MGGQYKSDVINENFLLFLMDHWFPIL